MLGVKRDSPPLSFIVVILVFALIEVFYNRERLQQSHGCVSPVQCETRNAVPFLECPRNPWQPN